MVGDFRDLAQLEYAFIGDYFSDSDRLSVVQSNRLRTAADFLLFFIVVADFGRSPLIKQGLELFLDGQTASYFTGLGLSQIISNVPAVILLAPFTLFRFDRVSVADLVLGGKIEKEPIYYDNWYLARFYFDFFTAAFFISSD